MDKKAFRSWQRNRLITFAKSPEKLAEDEELLNLALSHPWIQKAQNIGLTFSLPLEVDTFPLIEGLQKKGKRIYIARCYPDRQMDFVYYEPGGELKETKFGVLEVASQEAPIKNDLDLLLVPGLGFSPAGNARIGFGGGYYDRFLAKYQNDYQFKTVSLVNSGMYFEAPLWPQESFDIPMDDLIIVKEIKSQETENNEEE
ncbi:5-formyltetrahydrofolate cyclo-ligase [Lactobacillus sp.]|uniref:5-formyltetrahydrofolate cyclo-ligase n=1 Tax=Lactobacillus sp. TaxID=1591 RepID=UPI003EF324B6